MSDDTIYYPNLYVTEDGGLKHISELWVYAQCDSCNIDMTESNGCNSYWINEDKMITICDKCRSDIYGDNNPL